MGGTGEKGSCDLHDSESRECQIKEEQESNSLPLTDFSFFRAIDSSRANSFKCSNASNSPELPPDSGSAPRSLLSSAGKLGKAETAKTLLYLDLMKETYSRAQKYHVCIFSTRCYFLMTIVVDVT